MAHDLQMSNLQGSPSWWERQQRDFTVVLPDGTRQTVRSINALAAAQSVAQANYPLLHNLTALAVDDAHFDDDGTGGWGEFGLFRHRPRLHRYDDLGIRLTVVKPEAKEARYCTFPNMMPSWVFDRQTKRYIEHCEGRQEAEERVAELNAYAQEVPQG